MLTSGAARVNADLAGESVYGLGNRSVGCRVMTPNGERWLRVITEPAQWAGDRPGLATPTWSELHGSLDALATHSTDRVCLDEQLVSRRLLAAFGVEVNPGSLTWSTAHGDLHWANLTAPRCWLLDWESWGSVPSGYDAALLLCASLLR
ncbi:MAG TPA: hypothetical protein VFQ77_01360 [Pseudonocardiaceae bacterium]|jgi:hypothetical protein|nr:hypothetical protein [Pseudonocardiaceae bacterium]